MRIGFIGLGRMGEAIATNLLKAGHELRVYNRTPEKADALVKLGARRVDSPQAAAPKGDVVFTMLSDDRAVREICQPFDLEDGIHVSLSTISPDLARELARKHTYVAAPVFGKPEAAAAAKLWIPISGPAAAKERIAPLLEAIGQGVYDYGEDPGAANVVKLAGNFMFAAAIEAMGEAFTLAQKNGIDRQQIWKMFTETLFDCPPYHGYGKMIASEHYQPVGAPPALIRKDMRLAHNLALESEVPMPLLSLVLDRLSATVARNEPDIDWCGFARQSSLDSGL